MEAKEVLRPSEVAPMLGVTTGRVYQLIAAGVIPAVRIGKALRIPRAAWESWLEEQREKSVWAAEQARRKASQSVDKRTELP
jgi:excisionase family DNA binding protein